MTHNLSNLSVYDLDTLASALRSGRLKPPFTEPVVTRIVHSALAESVISDLALLTQAGFTPEQIAVLVEAVRSERQSRKRPDEIIDLVTSGPEAPGITNRDTSVVVRELFAEANESVVLAGYAVYQGNEVFQSLADRMELIESLEVRFFLDIQRPDHDTSEPSILVRKFMRRLREHQWPEGRRLPHVFYDPRSLALDKRSSLHAKCVVIDSKLVFISSANFTNAGQERNIEVGVLIRSPLVAGQLTRHFALLCDSQQLLPAPGY